MLIEKIKLKEALTFTFMCVYCSTFHCYSLPSGFILHFIQLGVCVSSRDLRVYPNVTNEKARLTNIQLITFRSCCLVFYSGLTWARLHLLIGECER